MLGAEATFIDHGYETGIAFGFENAVLPDFVLSLRSRKCGNENKRGGK